MSKNTPHIFSKIVILSALIACLWSMTAYASTGWQRDDTGWWYNNQDGSYENSGWFKDDSGRWFYAGSDGYILTSAYTPDGYLVDKDGVWIENYTMYDGQYAIDMNYETMRDHIDDVNLTHHGSDSLIEWPSYQKMLPDVFNQYVEYASDQSICATKGSNGEYEFYRIRRDKSGDTVQYMKDYKKIEEDYYSFYHTTDIPDVWSSVGVLLKDENTLYTHSFGMSFFYDTIYTKRK